MGQGGQAGIAEKETVPAGVNVDIPHSARIYDYWLGGKDNFAVDRQVANAMIAAIPRMREMAAENRRFVHRVAQHLVEREGIRQFLDVGTGIPTCTRSRRGSPPTHGWSTWTTTRSCSRTPER